MMCDTRQHRRCGMARKARSCGDTQLACESRLDQAGMGTLAVITSRQQQAGAAALRGACRSDGLLRDPVMTPLTVRQALMAVKT